MNDSRRSGSLTRPLSSNTERTDLLRGPVTTDARTRGVFEKWVPGELYGLEALARSLAVSYHARGSDVPGTSPSDVDAAVAKFVRRAKERGAHAENIVILLQDAVRRALGPAPYAEDFITRVTQSCLRAYYRGD